MKKLFISLVLSFISTVAIAQSIPYAHFNSMIVKHSPDIKYEIVSQHNVTIINDSNHKKSYEFLYQQNYNNKVINEKKKSISVEAGQTYIDNFYLISTSKFPIKNKIYEVEARTWIHGDTEEFSHHIGTIKVE